MGFKDKFNKLAEKVRKENMPVLIEAVTYRVRGHSLRDAQRYRPQGEAKKWLDEYCPIQKFKDYLKDLGIFGDQEIKDIEGSVEKEIGEAVKFALESPFPDPSRLMEDIYA